MEKLKAFLTQVKAQPYTSLVLIAVGALVVLVLQWLF